MFLCSTLISALICAVIAVVEKPINVIQKMESGGIIPDVIDEISAVTIHIQYPNGKHVEFGKELTPTQVKDEPTIKFKADPSKYHVLLMTDPDAPTREDPKYREIQHWLVVNILGSDLSTGEVLRSYRGAGAPKNTGLHRYIFLAFEQPGKLGFEEERATPDSRTARINFSTRKFAQKYNLGKAIAGNYFQAQWDPYADELRKQVMEQMAQ